MIDHLFIPLAAIYLIAIIATYVLLQIGNDDKAMTQGEIIYCAVLWPLLLIYSLRG